MICFCFRYQHYPCSFEDYWIDRQGTVLIWCIYKVPFLGGNFGVMFSSTTIQHFCLIFSILKCFMTICKNCSIFRQKKRLFSCNVSLIQKWKFLTLQKWKYLNNDLFLGCYRNYMYLRGTISLWSVEDQFLSIV